MAQAQCAIMKRADINNFIMTLLIICSVFCDSVVGKKGGGWVMLKLSVWL